VTSHPDVLFQIIINPNSGPNDTDGDYLSCVEQLKNAGSNVNLVGYVSTQYGDRAEEDVSADIQTYASWDDAYRLDGIFFDEEADTADKVGLYADYASEARNAFPGGTVSIWIVFGITLAERIFLL
jgi:hypothetical protein